MKTFTAEGMATSIERIEKTTAAYTEMPATNMWWRPHEEAEHGDRDARERDEAVAEDLLARERRDELADDPHRRQNHDVDGRVRVEPEEVLEQHGIAAQLRVEDADVEEALGGEQQHGDGDRPACRGS